MEAVADGPVERGDLKGPAFDIAHSTTSPLRVCAGPGTGKTFALMQRVKQLIADGADPERIFVVTFTRTAARDLASSLRKLNTPDTNKVRTSTLHSYYFKTLRRDAVLESTGRVARPLLEFEVRFLMWDIKREGRGVKANEQLLKAFEADWAREQSEDPGWPKDQADQDFHNDILDWLKYHHCMLIGELGNKMRSYLRNHPLSEERKFFHHILVDEFQDLNRTDQQIIDMLTERSKVVVVGDEDQSIFGFLRHAQPEGIRDYPQSHPGTVDIPLDVCRRCPTKVVEMANSLIRNNGDRAQRTLGPFKGNPVGHVKIVQYPTVEAEAVGLANLIHNYITNKGQSSEKISLEDILILAPRRYSSTLIKQALRAHEIESFNYYDDKILASKEAQRAFTILSLLANADDAVALRCWIGVDRKTDAGAPMYAKLREYADHREVNVPQALALLAAMDPPAKGMEPIVAKYVESQKIRAVAAQLTGRTLIDYVFPAEDLALEDIRRLALLCIPETESEPTAEELLDELKLRLLQNEPPPVGEYIRIMSPHRSKGLTAKLVVVASCMEGWLPSLSDEAITHDDALRYEREQRRLFYVAITRCTEAMVLSSFEQMPLVHAHRSRLVPRGAGRAAAFGTTSRFISELGPHAPTPEAG